MTRENVTRLSDGELEFIKYLRGEFREGLFLEQTISEALRIAIKQHLQDIEMFGRNNMDKLVKHHESKVSAIEEFLDMFQTIR